MNHENWEEYANLDFKTEKDIIKVLSGFGVDSYNRMIVFLKIAPKLRGRIYWLGLIYAYTNSDNLYPLKENIKKAYLSKEPYRVHLMNKNERAFFKNLPDVFKIYRGMTLQEMESGDFGISWSLSPEIADFFANKYMRNYKTNHLKKIIHQLEVNKKDIIAYNNSRNEHEIIYINKSIYDNSY